MQIPTLVRRYTLIFLRYLFARDVFHILWLWHSVVFDYNYCCDTLQVNGDQLGYRAVMHGHV